MSARKRARHLQLPEEVRRAEFERARSGAAGTHGDRRTKRVRTRNAQKQAALREW